MLRFEIAPTSARLIRLVCRKYRRSPVTDWLFMGGIEVTDDTGENIALGRPYRVSPPSLDGKYGDDGVKLTDGLIDGPYEDGRSVGWPTQEAALWECWPALVEVPYGKGVALIAFTKLSAYREREYRLTHRWEGLMRHISLTLVPSEKREETAQRYVPVACWTEPRAWTSVGSAVTVYVETVVGAQVTAWLDGKKLRLRRAAAGRYEARLLPTEGEHQICIVVQTEVGHAQRTLSFRVSDRRSAYQRALDRNMRWLARSGVLPKGDGSLGVWSQRCLAWFDGGPDEFLASPFRVDCNAATAQAAFAYGELICEPSWKQIGLNIAHSMLPHQYLDPSKPSFGAWPWLYENDESIYFWDDNTRVATALLWLYTRSGDEELLRAGMRTMELCREVTQPDGLIVRHVITASQLDQIGRNGFRYLPPQGLAVDFDLMRWAWAYGVTGDPLYERLLSQAIGIWGGVCGYGGAAFAAWYERSGAADEHARALWQEFLEQSSVKHHGVMLAGPGDYTRAYIGDCSITTDADEPLSDQLYITPQHLLRAWWCYKATGDERCLQAFESIGDFLVRIQYESNDARIDGAWMRGFDVRHWEYYGAPYDPAYGPYSAYTGWMNAFVATAFAQYLMDANPLPPYPVHTARAAEVLVKLRADRAIQPYPVNVALGTTYTFDVSPAPAYADKSIELTDGLLDGPYTDGRSVGWHLPTEGSNISVTVTLDLGRPHLVAAVAQRYGAGHEGYVPDRVTVLCGMTLEALIEVASIERQGAGAGSRFIIFSKPVSTRYIRFVLQKRRHSPTTDFLFVGETEAFKEL
ncbi:MAG: discoidin domain-containing protein [Candidatus Zipacnadales bacterium]